MPLSPHIETFTRFASGYLTGSADDELINLKIDHSLKVLENATAIVERESMDADMAQLCLLAALYHDIGRFPQFATYRTFNDRESINHGRMGVLTLRELGLPDDLSDKDKRIIRFTVGQHNLKSIRSALPPHLGIPVYVVRDADKLDIFRVMIAHFNSDTPNPLVTLGMGKNLDEKYSENVYHAVITQQDGDYTLLRNANDFLLMLLGWVFNLHFRTTLDLICQRNHLEDIFSLLPKDDNMQRLEEKVHTFIRYNKPVVS